MTDADPFTPDCLFAAWNLVRRRGRTPGVDGVTLRRFSQELEWQLPRLAKQIRRGDYRPRPLRIIQIRKPAGGLRRIAIPSVRDRVVQRALLTSLTPLAEDHLLDSCVGFRPGRGVHFAVNRVHEWSTDDPRAHALHLDIEDCFGNIPHDRVRSSLRSMGTPEGWIELVDQWLQAPNQDGFSWRLERGLPQGLALSPMLCNLVLTELDQELRRTKYLRYGDDLIAVCHQGKGLQRLEQRIADSAQALGLRLNTGKSVRTTFGKGIEFLGWRFRGDKIRCLHRKPPRIRKTRSCRFSGRPRTSEASVMRLAPGIYITA